MLHQSRILLGAATLALLAQAVAGTTRADEWSALQPVKRPGVPAVRNAAWVRNPVDAFIAAEHEARGLRPRPEAGRASLLRRVYYDLIGLPPTPEELRAFLADSSPEAYERVVDRLLDDPRYGERWGRHWMDVWRYSDWAGWGKQVRDSQPHIWRWRDWIVESLNADKGYDRMVVEMLAGDELAPGDASVLRATGYLVRNFKLLSREKWMQDTVDHTAQAFLGVTLGCARCHDHMYDPISQKEYYQVRAVFEPYQVRIDRVPGQPDTTKDGLVHAFDATPDARTFLYVRGDDRNPAKTPLAPGTPEALGGHFPAVRPVQLPPAAFGPDRRDFVIQETLAQSQQRLRSAQQALAHAELQFQECTGRNRTGLGADPAKLAAVHAAVDELALAQAEVTAAAEEHAALVATVRAERLEDAGRKDTSEWKEAATAASEAQRVAAVARAKHAVLLARQVVVRSSAQTKGAEAKKLADAEKALEKALTSAKQPATTAYTPRGTVYPRQSTGRRLAFARWIANRDNPLTARVAVNHIWMRHFGRGIVPTPADFGQNGQPPSHPALLDWLAAEFMDRGWSMKAIHRVLVTSNTYRMASTTDPAELAADRDNKCLWRMPSRRLEAEAVRDAVFYVAGRLDERQGGPEIDHGLGLTVPRRSLYFQHAAEKQMVLLQIFDGPEVNECYERRESVVPQQALALFNSELTLTQARALAERISARVGPDDAAFATRVFETTLSRPPTPAERESCVDFLRREQNRTGRAADARARLAHVMLNHDEFVTVR